MTQNTVTYQDVMNQVAAGDMTLLDVRNHDEVADSGKAKGAVHIPLGQLAMQADPSHPDFHTDLFTNKPVAVYCAAGGRAGMAVETLTKLGYESAINIGGFKDWVEAGGDVER